MGRASRLEGKPSPQVRCLVRVALQLAARAPTAGVQLIDGLTFGLPRSARPLAQRMVYASVAAYPSQLLIADLLDLHDTEFEGPWSPTGYSSWSTAGLEFDTRDVAE